MRDGAASTRPASHQLAEELRAIDRPSAGLKLLAAIVEPPGTLPTHVIQRQILKVAEELRCLEERLDLLRDYLDLPPGAFERVGSRLKDHTFESTLYWSLGVQSHSLRRSAEYLRKVALPRPHLDLVGVDLKWEEDP